MTNTEFTLHKIDGYVINIYVAEYPHGLLVFDGGSPGDVRRIEELCSKIGRKPTDIKLIALAHVHPDHSGAARILRKKYNIPVLAHKNIDRWYMGITGRLQYQFDLLLVRGYALKQHKPNERVRSERFIKPDYTPEEGEKLPFFPDWEVVYTPGHTLHDIVFYNRTAKVMFVSDCMVKYNDMVILPMPIPFRGRMRKSYEKMAGLEAHKILIGHGAEIVTDDSRAIFESLIALMRDPLRFIPRWMNRIYIFPRDIWTRLPKKLVKICKIKRQG